MAMLELAPDLVGSEQHLAAVVTLVRKLKLIQHLYFEALGFEDSGLLLEKSNMISNSKENPNTIKLQNECLVLEMVQMWVLLEMPLLRGSMEPKVVVLLP